MAEVNSIFRLSGKLGNKVFKQINGKTYAASLPAHYNTPQTPEAKARRAKFKLCRMFVLALCKLFYIRLSWNSCKTKKVTLAGGMFKENYPLIAGNNINLTKMSPENHFYIINPTLDQEEGRIITSCIIPGGQGFMRTYSESVISEGIIYLCNLEADLKERFLFIPLVSDEKPLVLDEQIQLTFPVSGLQSDLINSYSEKIFMQVIIVKNYESNDLVKGQAKYIVLMSGKIQHEL